MEKNVYIDKEILINSAKNVFVFVYSKKNGMLLK